MTTQLPPQPTSGPHHGEGYPPPQHYGQSQYGRPQYGQSQYGHSAYDVLGRHSATGAYGAWQQGPGHHGMPQSQEPGRNGLATGGFVVALVGFVLSLIPIVGTVSWLLSPVGLVLSAVGLALAGRRRAGKGLAVAGVILGVLGLLMCVLYTAAFASAVSSPMPSSPAAASPAAGTSAASTVRYEVTGSGRGMVTFTDGKGNMGQQTSARLPWTKDIRPEGVLNFYTVSVTNSGGSGTVGCKIVKDGTVVAEQSAAGQYATASCSGS